ncbi:MAG: DUF2846 domain-containing protein [Thiobacillus sp.]|nr:DUF2846 domain-containing protein [Thiobacillus sp.]
MRLTKKFAVLAFVFLSVVNLQGCVSTRVIQTNVYAAPSQDQDAVIYFYRDVTMPTKVNLDVKIDDKKVALLPPSRFTWVKVSPGRHLLSVGYPSLLDLSAKSEIVTEAGKVYLFKYLSSSGGGTMPVFGASGAFMGTIPIGPAAWTLLQKEPEENISKVIGSHQYVAAQIEQ